MWVDATPDRFTGFSAGIRSVTGWVDSGSMRPFQIILAVCIIGNLAGCSIGLIEIAVLPALPVALGVYDVFIVAGSVTTGEVT